MDHTALSIRNEADDIVPNNGSLEELRWRVDDKLFESLSLSPLLKTRFLLVL